MALLEARSGRRPRVQAPNAPALVGYVALAALVLWWAWRAFHDPNTNDLGLAYQGGQVAWATGHPEHLLTWISLPFLGLVMAVITKVMSASQAAILLNLVNALLVVGTVAYVLYRLRRLLAPVWWWVLAFALLSFGPMLSTVWWKQFNMISLVLLLGGFELIRRRQTHAGGAAIGLSIAIKPLAILLPFVLLARRETRRAGVISLAYVIALNVIGQVFMAWRAHSLGALNVVQLLQTFAHKSQPANYWACVPENFAPGSLLCRLVGGQHWTLQHLIVWAAVALLALWVVDALRGSRAISWEVFAFTCALSTMVSPIAWSHYQIMLAPLFVLLLVRFSREGASASAWAGLAVAFFLASLMWQPYGTLIGAAKDVVTGGTQTEKTLLTIEEFAQFAQYILILTGVLWYTSANRFRTTSPTAPPNPSYAS
jgi:Glycosyltransferase family 87